MAKTEDFLKNRVWKNIKNGVYDVPATSFRNEHIAEQALRDALNTDIGKKKIKEVIRLSRKKIQQFDDNISFDIKNISNDLGYGFKAVNGEVKKIRNNLTNVKVVLKPDYK